MTHKQTSYRFVAGSMPPAWWPTYTVLVKGSPVRRVKECLTGANGYATCLLQPFTLSWKGPYFGPLTKTLHGHVKVIPGSIWASPKKAAK